MGDVVVSESFGTAPAAKPEDGVWLNTGVDARHDPGLLERLGGKHAQVEACLFCNVLQDSGAVLG